MMILIYCRLACDDIIKLKFATLYNFVLLLFKYYIIKKSNMILFYLIRIVGSASQCKLVQKASAVNVFREIYARRINEHLRGIKKSDNQRFGSPGSTLTCERNGGGELTSRFQSYYVKLARSICMLDVIQLKE